jgi:UDP-N-acetylglucosamine 2-epimerase (non-hydrolysing)
VVDALRSLGGERRAYREPALARVVEGDGRLVLLTAHRRESFGPPLRRVFAAVRRVVEAHPDVEVVYPVHPNPRVREPARELLAGHPRIHLTDPVGYPDLVGALRDAALVLTDSGGIQEEAPAFGTPVLVLRQVTERPEGVEAGVAELVGTDPDRIVEAAGARLGDPGGSAPPVANPYGDGRAGERIADIVVSELTGAPRRTEDWVGPAPEGTHAIPGAGIPGEGRAG